MAFAIGPANSPNGSSMPEVRVGAATVGNAIITGSVLIYSSNLLVVGATTPSVNTIVGVAAAPDSSAPGYNMANQPTVVTFREDTIPYYVANTRDRYISHFCNGSDTYIAPATTDIGVSYGIRKAATGEWIADKALVTTDARLIIRAIDIGNLYVTWNWLSTAILGP